VVLRNFCITASPGNPEQSNPANAMGRSSATHRVGDLNRPSRRIAFLLLTIKRRSGWPVNQEIAQNAQMVLFT
jgi:hypothetical protein